MINHFIDCAQVSNNSMIHFHQQKTCETNEVIISQVLANDVLGYTSKSFNS